ncbi:hypothetical protein Tco_1522424 [Tanacetum coccineum]
MVNVKIRKCMSWLGSTNAYDEPISSLGMLDNEVGNTCPLILPSFEEYTPPVTYPEEVEETLGTPMEVEPLDQTTLEDLGLTNHDIPLSFRKVPSFDEPRHQPQPLPNCPSLDVSLGDERGPEPPIKPYSPDSFRMKHLEEKHVTWARFEKKLDKNTTLQACDFHSDAFTKSAQKVKFLIKSATSQTVETASDIYHDVVKIVWRRRQSEA